MPATLCILLLAELASANLLGLLGQLTSGTNVTLCGFCAEGQTCTIDYTSVPPRIASSTTCPAGIYCRADSTDGGEACPEGIYPYSDTRLTWTLSTYCSAGLQTGGGPFTRDQLLSNGYFGPFLCPAGSLCPTPNVSIPCKAGSYCEQGSNASVPCTDPEQCPEGSTANAGKAYYLFRVLAASILPFAFLLEAFACYDRQFARTQISRQGSRQKRLANMRTQWIQDLKQATQHALHVAAQSARVSHNACKAAAQSARNTHVASSVLAHLPHRRSVWSAPAAADNQQNASDVSAEVSEVMMEPQNELSSNELSSHEPSSQACQNLNTAGGPANRMNRQWSKLRVQVRKIQEQSKASSHLLVSNLRTRAKSFVGVVNAASSNVQIHPLSREKFDKGKCFVRLRVSRLGFSIGKAQLLKDVSFTAQEGQLVGLIGESGSGKSTLLNVLGGRSSYGEVHRCTTPRDACPPMLLNLQPHGPQKMKKLVGFVPQGYIIFKELTVYENLLCASLSRGDKSMSAEAREDLIEITLQVLNLQACRHFVCDPNIGKERLSGGQLRRVGIGIELVGDMPILLLDEPTSALDAVNTRLIVAALKDITKRGVLIIASLQQPRATVFHMLDKLLLMRHGELAYGGSVENAQAFFQHLGYPNPLAINPADYYIEVCFGMVDPEPGAHTVSDRDPCTHLAIHWAHEHLRLEKADPHHLAQLAMDAEHARVDELLLDGSELKARGKHRAEENELTAGRRLIVRQLLGAALAMHYRYAESAMPPGIARVVMDATGFMGVLRAEIERTRIAGGLDMQGSASFLGLSSACHSKSISDQRKYTRVVNLAGWLDDMSDDPDMWGVRYDQMIDQEVGVAAWFRASEFALHRLLRAPPSRLVELREAVHRVREEGLLQPLHKGESPSSHDCGASTPRRVGGFAGFFASKLSSGKLTSTLPSRKSGSLSTPRPSGPNTPRSSYDSPQSGSPTRGSSQLSMSRRSITSVVWSQSLPSNPRGSVFASGSSHTSTLGIRHRLRAIGGFESLTALLSSLRHGTPIGDVTVAVPPTYADILYAIDQSTIQKMQVPGWFTHFKIGLTRYTKKLVRRRMALLYQKMIALCALATICGAVFGTVQEDVHLVPVLYMLANVLYATVVATGSIDVLGDKTERELLSHEAASGMRQSAEGIARMLLDAIVLLPMAPIFALPVFAMSGVISMHVGELVFLYIQIGWSASTLGYVMSLAVPDNATLCTAASILLLFGFFSGVLMGPPEGGESLYLINPGFAAYLQLGMGNVVRLPFATTRYTIIRAYMRKGIIPNDADLAGRWEYEHDLWYRPSNRSLTLFGFAARAVALFMFVVREMDFPVTQKLMRKVNAIGNQLADVLKHVANALGRLIKVLGKMLLRAMGKQSIENASPEMTATPTSCTKGGYATRQDSARQGLSPPSKSSPALVGAAAIAVDPTNIQHHGEAGFVDFFRTRSEMTRSRSELELLRTQSELVDRLKTRRNCPPPLNTSCSRSLPPQLSPVLSPSLSRQI